MKAIFSLQNLILVAIVWTAVSATGQSLLPAGPLIVRMNCGDENPNTVGKDTLLVADPDSSILNNFTILTYRWQGPPSEVMQSSTESSYRATKSASYILSVTARSVTDSTKIQTFSDTIEVFFIASCCEARMPNAFTPNGDNKNDVFEPVIPENCDFRTYQLQVFNRWGKKVFDTNNGELGWDGKLDGKDAPSDVYVYVLTYISQSKDPAIPENDIKSVAYNPPIMKGDVTLIR